MATMTELSRVMDSVCKDKGIEKGEIVSAVEEAVLSAAQKLFRMQDKEKELEVHFNEDDGDVELFEFKTVVEDIADPDMEISVDEAVKLDPEAELGDQIGVKINPEFTRIAIQNAKQKILQSIKEAEGKVIYEEFKGTGNWELILNRKLSERGTFPAVDVLRSGTRRTELMLNDEKTKNLWLLRRMLSAVGDEDAIELMMDQLRKTEANADFLANLTKQAL